MNKKMLVAMGLGLVCAFVGLISLLGTTVNSVSFDKVASVKDRVEVYGVLDRASIRPIRGATLVSFALQEEKTGRRLDVVYDNPASSLPGNFPAASHARCAGTYDPVQKKLVVDRVLTKCPSNNEEKNLDLATRGALNKWRAGTGASAQL